MDQTKIDLINLVANRLTGKQAKIRNQSPATIGNIGEIHCSPEGQLIIDISPDIRGDQKLLHVVLHEIAHAKHHRFLRSNQVDQQPGTIVNKRLNWGDQLREDTAEAQVAEWEAWGKANANQELYKITPFVAVMIALLTYPGGKA